MKLALAAGKRHEFDVARRIHASMRDNQNDGPEVLDELSDENAARGRRLARQVGLAFIVLVAMNVLLGLVYITRHEIKNPNRQLLDDQAREHLRKLSDPLPHASRPRGDPPRRAWRAQSCGVVIRNPVARVC